MGNRAVLLVAEATAVLGTCDSRAEQVQIEGAAVEPGCPVHSCGKEAVVNREVSMLHPR